MRNIRYKSLPKFSTHAPIKWLQDDQHIVFRN